MTLKSYDPCFTVVDEKVLDETHACETLTREACDEYLSASTSGKDEIVVFYMPHCEGHLYESVVRARWSAEALADFICVGNTLETTRDRWALKVPIPKEAAVARHRGVEHRERAFGRPGGYVRRAGSVQRYECSDV